MEEEGAIPHDASGGLDIRQDQVQEFTVLGNTAPQNTAPHSPLDPESAPQHPSPIVPKLNHFCSSEQSPEMNLHIPQRSSTLHLTSTQPSPLDPPRQTSEHVQERSPQSSATQASLVAGVDMDHTGPPNPDSSGSSPQVSNHVKRVRSRVLTTLEPSITIDGPPRTPTLNLPRISPTYASQHTQSPDSFTQKSTFPAQPFVAARPTDRTSARSAPHATPSQMFQVVGRILTPDYDQPGTWSLLHVDTLMSRNVTDFYGSYSRLVQPARALPVLRFELLDMAPELASRFPYSTSISCGDHISFQALKRSIFGCFKATFAKSPRMQMFRIMVTPELAPHFRQASIGDSAEGRGNSSPGTQLRAVGSNSSSAMLAPFESLPGPQNTLTRPPSTAPAPSYHKTGLGTHPLPGVVVRIQVNRHGSLSEPFPKTVLAPKVTNAEFFAWFAKQTGYGGPIGPAELSFSFKDVVPTPKINVIARGNEEHFEYMKRDIRPMCELTTAKVPGLSEFAILVTVPGWVLEKQDDTW